MKLNRMKHFTSLSMLAALLLSCAGLPTHAQDGPKSPSNKSSPNKSSPNKSAPGQWRPKDGTYATPGRDFDARCGEYGDTRIDWSDNDLGRRGRLQDHQITGYRCRQHHTDVFCDSADREGHPYKEIILLKKIDEKTIFLRETQDGKFKRSGGPMAYCPDSAQRMYRDSKKKG